MTEADPDLLALPPAFAVKVPMFPVHTWLTERRFVKQTPAARVWRPQLKMGGMDFLRLSPAHCTRRPRNGWADHCVS